jgi:uncharacterized membrane protein YfcA
MYALLLYLSSILIGLDKGGVPGLGALGLTTVLSLAGPGHLARRTIGIFVPTLAVADVSAIYVYRDAVRWDIIRGMVLPMAIGMWFGFLCLGRLPDEDVRLFVGWALLVVSIAACYNSVYLVFSSASARSALYKSLSSGNVVALSLHDDKNYELPTRSVASSCNPQRSSVFSPHVIRAFVGCIAGLLTVIANVAGPIVAVYLVSLQLPKRQINGTRAWLFLISNACKIPGQILLGNLRLSDAGTVLPLCIAAALSTYATELYIFPRIEQRLFERLSWGSVSLARSYPMFLPRLASYSTFPLLSSAQTG